jgi:DNA-binding response OmpR family regulator
MEAARILVVDDEGQVCESVKSFLGKRGYAVSAAQTAGEALELISKERPHLVLLDVRLGDISGMDVLRKIKQCDKNIKVIMITALSDDESISRAKYLGADGYVVKPFTTDYLNGLILQEISYLGLPKQ